MFYRISDVVPIIFSAAAVLAAGPAARADEAYLCGPDKVVYVKAAELELKKHSDPCIAAYFGISLEVKANSKVPAVAAEVTTSKAAEAAPAVEFKRLTEADVPIRQNRLDVHAALTAPPTPSPGTDYRNVRVINAPSGDGQWFKHAR